MLRQLPLPSETDPSQPVIPGYQVGRAQRAASITAQASAEAARTLRGAATEAAALREQASVDGYRDGCTHALRTVVPVLADLLAERARWMASVRRTLLDQLGAELARLDFTQTQIERWCAMQSDQGAQQMAIYLPAHQQVLQQALQQSLGDTARVELADVPAPIVSADDLVFVLEPASNLQINAASEPLDAEIQSFAEHQAERYRRLAVEPAAASIPSKPAT